MSKKVHSYITDRMIEALEQGTVPWQKPWDPQVGQPRNLRGRKYRGVNVWLLSLESFTHNYSSPYWLTYRQAKKAGGHVKKGESATPVIFWKWIEKETENEDGESETISFPILRYYNVFNLDQTEGVEAPEADCANFDPISEAQTVIDDMPNPPEITHGGSRAFYSVAHDAIRLPAQHAFDRPEGYYSVAFHELVHSTGHSSRLDRIDVEVLISFDTEDYSKEELVAEMGSAFLCALVGIEQTFDNSAAYISSWLRELQDDKTLVVYAAARAQKAIDYILDVQFDN